LFSGIKFIPGSLNEKIAIIEFNRQRAIQYITPLLSVASPEKRGEIVRKFRGLIFPEDAYDDVDYVKKAAKLFEKIKNVSFYIKPGGGG